MDQTVFPRSEGIQYVTLAAAVPKAASRTVLSMRDDGVCCVTIPCQTVFEEVL